jgi:colanic acid biosynthesis glycosyl transferase WcaI
VKILVHGLNYYPESTGVGKYTGEMCEWLAVRGHDVRVVTTPPYYPAWCVGEGYSARTYRRERVARTHIWRCPLWVPAKPSGIKRLLHLASFAASSFPIMLRQVPWRPDIVVLIEPTLFSAPSAWLTARLGGAKTWLHVQDFELDAAAGLQIFGKGRVQYLLHKIEMVLLRGAQRVSTITEPMRWRLVQKGIRESWSYLFPNWTDLDFVRPMPQNDEVRWEFGARPGDILALYAGNMGEKQGLELILDAADQLREREEIKFALVGTGTARERLERVARQRKLGNVRFFPLQPLKRLPVMLAAGDIHLVVQKREAADLVMPSKLTNILAAGRASIATAEPGTALYETLHKHECGIIAAPGSVKELSTGITMLAESASMRDRLGWNARQYAESYLGKDNILREFESRLQKLVEARL